MVEPQPSRNPSLLLELSCSSHPRSAQTGKEIKALHQRQDIHLLVEGHDRSASQLAHSWLREMPMGVLPFLDQVKSNAPQVVRHLFINPGQCKSIKMANPLSLSLFWAMHSDSAVVYWTRQHVGSTLTQSMWCTIVLGANGQMGVIQRIKISARASVQGIRSPPL